jgi:hypothetical protein
MRWMGANEVIGYFWIFVVLVFVGLMWWKLDSLLHRDEICVLQKGFICLDKRLFLENGKVHVEMRVKNSLGRWAEVTGFLCSSETPDPSLGKPQREFEDLKVNVLSDSDFQITGTCHGAPEKDGGIFKGLVYLRYEYRDEPSTPGSQMVVGNVWGAVRQN